MKTRAAAADDRGVPLHFVSTRFGTPLLAAAVACVSRIPRDRNLRTRRRQNWFEAYDRKSRRRDRRRRDSPSYSGGGRGGGGGGGSGGVEAAAAAAWRRGM